MSLFQQLRLFIDKHAIRGTKATWSLFILYALVIFITVMAAHWFIFHSVYISSLWTKPSIFFGFWLPKICISLFLAFFVLITKRKWWTVVLLCIIDTWIIANIIYNRANNCLLTWDAMMMASNLEGFGSSIGFYWNEQCTFFIILTTLYALCVPFFRTIPVKKSKWIVAAAIVVIYFIGAECCRINMSDDTKTDSTTFRNYIPFCAPQEIRQKTWRAEGYYATMHSMIAYFPMLINSAIVDACTEEEIMFTEEEKNTLSLFINDTTHCELVPKYNVMFVLVESLETFSLHSTDAQGNYLLPNLRNLLYQSNTFFADKITSQVRHGCSIDGQQILTTGLLPLQYGAAAMVYGRNTYPNYAHLFETSMLSNPFYAATWNQNIVTYSYGFDRMLGGERVLVDSETFDIINPTIQTCSDSTFCYLAITVSSHSPFDRVPKNPTLQFDADMPQIMQDYLTCLHYTDSCFGIWYNEWKETEQAKNTVLVITGDHTVFKDAILQEFQPYAQQVGLSIASGKTYCPLIIQAPQITENIQITDVCYQMDIYPTIMHLIGCEDYFWKGFGVNLLDSTARHNRPITEEQAYALSDKMIRVDYFRTIVDSLNITIKDREPIFEP